VLLFDDETKDHGHPIAERKQFEDMEGGKQLILLEKEPGEDRDWYAGNYKKRPVRPSNAGPQIIPDCELPGTCCSEGCANTHDTAFNPCGHTVCCWECAKPLETCPVCGIAVTCAPGIDREARDLCYDHKQSEANYQQRVEEGRTRDKAKEDDIKQSYNELLIEFKAPKADDPWQAESDSTTNDAFMEIIQRYPEKVEDQRRLWPYYITMLEQKDELESKAAAELEQEQQQAAIQKQRAAAELKRQEQQAAAKLKRQAQQAAAKLEQQEQQAAAAWEMALQRSAQANADFQSKLEVQKRQLEDAAALDARDLLQQLTGKQADLEKHKQMSLQRSAQANADFQSKLKKQQDESEAKLKEQQDESEAKLKEQQEKCQCKCVIM
jgi:DNA repair exonuclease SbcCD ATPase subunit